MELFEELEARKSKTEPSLPKNTSHCLGTLFGQGPYIKDFPWGRDRASSQGAYFAEMIPGKLLLTALSPSPPALHNISFSSPPLLQILGGFQVNMAANLGSLNHIQSTIGNHHMVCKETYLHNIVDF